MSVIVIAYPPSGGGNHLKNLLCLAGTYENSHELNTENYTNGSREVHSTPGRNMNQWRIDQAKATVGDYIIHGHFGELAPFREEIYNIVDKKIVCITIDTIRDRDLLKTRQHRLGQHNGNKYYLDEEQFYLYRPNMYQTYFGSENTPVFSYPLAELWQPKLTHSHYWHQMCEFLGAVIDIEPVEFLHSKWRSNNF